MSINLILCPVDFSEASRHATQYATSLAAFTGAKIVALHVYQPALATVPAAIGRDDPVAEPLLAGSPDIQGRIAAQFDHEGLNGVAVAPHLAIGEPADAIAEHALTNGADVIVIGTRGAGGLQHLLLGSVTEDVIRKSTAPVLAVPPRAVAQPALPFKRVLCATDLSASSLAALEAALRLVDAEVGTVTVLHVVDDPGENELFVARPYDVHRHADALDGRVRDSLTQVTGRLFEGRRPPQLRIAHGRASQQVLAVAAEIDADLIVMGVHGRNAFGVAVFGSTTNDVVRRAACPVLTARR